MTPIRVFASFDADHDADLEDRLRAQFLRPGGRFELSGASRHGSQTDAWTAAARQRIRAADEVLFLCGEHTDSSSRVAAEMRIAQEEGKPYLLVWGRREQMCTRPEGALKSDAMYSWTREILESRLEEALRRAEPVSIPDSCKRA